MKIQHIIILSFIAIIASGCEQNKTIQNTKELNPELATVGILMFEDVLTTEVTAAAEVFSKTEEDGTKIFNVVTIADNDNPIHTADGLTLIPDYSFEDSPTLDVLFIPSAMDMTSVLKSKKVVDFISEKDKETTYTVSNCSGAQLVGASGIAEGRKIVTYIGGGTQLQQDYPNLNVQDDATVTFVEDGKYSSSNGNLASYVSALNLLEKMTSPQHRKYVESQLYLDRLQNWQL